MNIAEMMKKTTPVSIEDSLKKLGVPEVNDEPKGLLSEQPGSAISELAIQGSRKLPTIVELEEEDRGRALSYLSVHRPDLAALLVSGESLKNVELLPVETVEFGTAVFIPCKVTGYDSNIVHLETLRGGIKLAVPKSVLVR